LDQSGVDPEDRPELFDLCRRELHGLVEDGQRTPSVDGGVVSDPAYR
jgi:hypothetical protein